MFKKIALATVALAALTSVAHAGNRDLSAFNATAKAQIFVGLDYYKNNCSALPTPAGEIHAQLAKMNSEMDQVVLNKLKSDIALITVGGDDDTKAKVCNDLAPTVDKMNAIAEAMPAVEPVAPALRDWSDRTYVCNKEDIKRNMTTIIENSRSGRQDGVKLVYVKGEPVEVGRSKNELRCEIEVHTNRPNDPWKGVIRFHNVKEEGMMLAEFAPFTPRF